MKVIYLGDGNVNIREREGLRPRKIRLYDLAAYFLITPARSLKAAAVRAANDQPLTSGSNSGSDGHYQGDSSAKGFSDVDEGR